MKPIALKDQAEHVRVDGEGRPVVLLHGLGADSSQVTAALPAPEGYRFIAPDLPGHGSAQPAPAGFQHFADRVRALLDRLAIERAVLGGISMGAGIALRLALDAPQRVVGLILIRPSWLDGPALPHLGIVARVGRWLQDSPEHAAANLAADTEYRDIARTNPAAAQSVRGLLTRPQGPTGAVEAAAVLGAMVADRPFHSLDALSAIGCPALVVANDGDPLHPVRIADAIAARLPRARYDRIPSRYLASAEHFAALRAATLKFLNQLGDF